MVPLASENRCSFTASKVWLSFIVSFFFPPQNVPFTLGLFGHRLAIVQGTGGSVQEPASV